jgi:nitronate monooxygenase/enoyl-[acyl-carrier protein] reductase II
LLGAQGANLGTRFLASVEAPVSEGYKKAILAAQSEDTLKVELWNDIMPVPGRGGYGTVPRAIKTAFVEKWQDRRDEAVKNADRLRAEITGAAQQGSFHEYVPFAGQTVGLINDILPAGDIVRRIVQEARRLLDSGAKLGAQV